MKKRGNGFTLIELLAVIFIISLLFGVSFFYVNNVINSSKEKSRILTESSIKKSASLYVQEYANKVVWKDDSGGVKKACVNISDLREKGYIKEQQVRDVSIKAVYLTKKNGSIFTEKVVDEDCDGNIVIPIPTSKEYCNNPTYDEMDRDLATVPSKYVGKVLLNDNKKRDAGSYEVKVSLVDNNIFWSDGSKSEKTITCFINKAMPTVSLNPIGQSGRNVGTSTVATITSSTKGTLSVKSSNSNYVTGLLSSNQIIKNGTVNLSVSNLASREGESSYLYVTLMPEDFKNYYSVTAIYTIGDVNLNIIDIPDSNLCEKSLNYNGEEVKLVNSSSNVGYIFKSMTKDSEVGTYTIVASLKYGYAWNTSDEKEMFSDKSFECTIKGKNYSSLTIQSVKSTDGNSEWFNGTLSSGTVVVSKSVTFTLKSDVAGSLSAKSSNNSNVSIKNISSSSDKKTHYVVVNGDKISDLTGVTFTLTPSDIDSYYPASTNYSLRVISNIYNIVYDYNGGSGGTYKPSSATYNESVQISNPTRSGYTFDGWKASNLSSTAKYGNSSYSINQSWNNGNTKVKSIWFKNLGERGNTVTLSAQWTKNSTPTPTVTRYTLTYDSNGGTSCSPTSKTVDSGDKWGTLCNPTRNG